MQKSNLSRPVEPGVESQAGTSSGRNVLKLREARPNSRDKATPEKMSRRSGHRHGYPSQKRQLPSDVPSPGSKENSTLIPPASKKQKSREENDHTSSQPKTATQQHQQQRLQQKVQRQQRNVRNNARNVSSDEEISSDSAGLQNRGPSLSPNTSRQKVLKKVTKKIQRRLQKEKEAREKKERGPPKPHKALRYYQEKLGGALDVKPSSGIIEKVELFNFMCHEHFVKEWNSNLNFITGENGSGKSAILSGIVVGLGARANITSRTKSVTELVKTGKEFAKIEITLLNDGILREEKYGKHVVLQRVIDVKGTSTYKIRDETRPRFRAMRRTELEFILLSLGIMIDNPVAVLNQETARSFLKTKDPRDKYKFFFEGSSLAQFDRMLAESQQNMADAEQNLIRSKAVVQERHEDVKKYKKLKERLEEAEKMEEAIDKLNVEYSWSLVIEDEKKLAEFKNQLELEQRSQAKCEDVHVKLVEKKEEFMNRDRLKPDDIENLKTQLRNGGKEEQDIRREMDQLLRQGNETKGKVRAAMSQISTLKRTIGNLEEKIEELSTTGEKEAEAAQREHDAKVDKLKEAKLKYDQEFVSRKNELDQFIRGSESLRTQFNDLKEKEKEVNQRLVRLKDEMRNLQNKNSKINKYSAFGRVMEELVAKIQANQRKFKVPPRGPLGACFTVKNEKWVRLIELILNNQLFDFLVENNDDQKILNQLIKSTFNGRSGRRPSVIFNKGAFLRPYDVTRTKATMEEHPTILDVIEIENNDVAVLNSLIDSCMIERILLFENNKDACDILKDRRHPDFPKTCSAGFTLEFYQITPDPRYRLDAKNEGHPNLYLKCSSVAQLRYVKQGITEAEADLEALLPELEAKRAEEGTVRQALNKQEDMLKAVRRKITEINTNLMTLSRRTTTKAPDIASFVDELNETKEELAAVEKHKQVAVNFYNEITPKHQELKEKKTRIMAENEELQSKIRELTDDHEHFQEKLLQITTNIRLAKEKLREAQARYEALKPRLETVEKSVAEKSLAAEAKGPRVETTRTPASLQEEVKEYGLRVDEAKKSAGNRDVILRELAAATERYNLLKAEHKCWFEVFRLLMNYVNSTANYYKMMVQVIGNVLISCFQSLIASRGYNGRLLIEHDKNELYYFICPDGDASEKTQAALNSNNNKIIKHFLTEYTHGLSGGERSFATICYIISMWQIMECPFFMLDEFDVFMDAFNRKASQNALISHANRYKGHQFFLFTPLEITELKETQNAIILRMFPPLRNNVRNNLSQVPTENFEPEVEDKEVDGGPAKRRAPQRTRK